MKSLHYKSELRIQSKYIVRRTGNQDKTEKIEPTTSDREIMLATRQETSNSFRKCPIARNSIPQIALYFVKDFEHY